MFRTFVLFLVCVTFVTAGHSPQFDYVKNLVESGDLGARFSNDILEDASLDVPDLVKKYKYPLEVHHVTTEDGYILEMHRIPHGRDRNNKPGPRPVVFVMHGLFSSSADWVLMGPGNGLAYILAEEGYDVWMGNARGNYYSRRHISRNPDSLLSNRFWQFTWDDIGNIDVPTMIDYALEKTQRQKLHYIGHSQGTTVFWVMASLRPEYNDKIISMHALAPVAYMANNRSLLLRIIARFGDNINNFASIIGFGEFLPNNLVMSWAGQALCMDDVAIQAVCSSIMFLVGGWNPDQHNSTMLPVKLGHTPAGASVQQLHHYGQSINSRRFRRYDLGTFQNWREYRQLTPPNYELNKITSPVFLHYSLSDPLAEVPDVLTLFRELGRPIGLFQVQDPKFSHLDFMWGIDAKQLVYNRVVSLIKAMDESSQAVDILDIHTID